MAGTETVRSVPMGASRDAIQFHYDLSNDFYRLWLDELMVYSCALWEEGDSLDRAQKRKLDYLIEQSGAAGKRRVLDVGCGWGGLLRRLRDVHGVGHAVGLTLSKAQAEYIDGLDLSEVEVRVENWTDHEPDRLYGAVISIGAFEHFAKPGLSRRDRVEAYRDFFRACRRWLPLGGGLALQTVTKGDNVQLSRGTADDMSFVMEQIFPESELPWLSEILEASERRFALVALRSDAAHYARTTRTWCDRLRERSTEAVALVGAQRVAEYDRYLDSFSREFDALHLNLVRLIFRRM